MRGFIAAGLAISIGCNSPAANSTSSVSSSRGYLPAGIIDLAKILPAAPTVGSPEDELDRQTFRETRSLAGGEAWSKAIAELDEGVPAILRYFSKPANMSLSEAADPRVARLLMRVRIDAMAAVNPAKAYFNRRRPFLVDPGPVCQPTGPLARSPDYPSGHSTWGVLVAMILAEMEPARATELMQAGRAYGDARVVCGAHNLSAVQAGRFAAAAIFTRLQADPGFIRDLGLARHEILANYDDRTGSARH